MRLGRAQGSSAGATTTVLPHQSGAMHQRCCCAAAAWVPPNRAGCLCLRVLVTAAGSALPAHARHRQALAAHLVPHQLPRLPQSLHQLRLHALQAQGSHLIGPTGRTWLPQSLTCAPGGSGRLRS